MALYKVVMERIPFPLHYLAGTGAYAKPSDVTEHKADKANSPLEVDERGNAEVAYDVLNEGSLVYQNEADFNSLSDEEKSNAYYVADQYTVNRYVEMSAHYVALGQQPVVEPYTASGGGDGTFATAKEEDTEQNNAEASEAKKAPAKARSSRNDK